MPHVSRCRVVAKGLRESAGRREMFLKIVYIVVYMKNMAYELVLLVLPLSDPQDQMMVARLHLVLPLLLLLLIPLSGRGGARFGSGGSGCLEFWGCQLTARAAA